MQRQIHIDPLSSRTRGTTYPSGKGVKKKTGFPWLVDPGPILMPDVHKDSQDIQGSMPTTGNYFHLHLVSDSTGETLITVARAVAAQYANVTAVEHVYPLVRSQKQLDRVLDEIEEAPGIVLFTLLEKDLVVRLEAKCKEINVPSLSIIGPVMQLFEAYLGAATTGRVGAQHVLNAEYFKRIDALNYTMMHDDGQHVEGLEDADVILVGVSRTSKTPTSIYLANRGIRTANVPLVPGIPIPHQLESLNKPLVVSLHATPERLIQVRQNRLLSMGADSSSDIYIDKQAVADEVAYARKLSAKFNWSMLDVTRRSIEETAAAVLKLYTDRQRQR
jgi:regulator of PEP synthase PpsR (kinase-PPPase family)